MNRAVNNLADDGSGPPPLRSCGLQSIKQWKSRRPISTLALTMRHEASAFDTGSGVRVSGARGPGSHRTVGGRNEGDDESVR